LDQHGQTSGLGRNCPLGSGLTTDTRGGDGGGWPTSGPWEFGPERLAVVPYCNPKQKGACRSVNSKDGRVHSRASPIMARLTIAPNRFPLPSSPMSEVKGQPYLEHLEHGGAKQLDCQNNDSNLKCISKVK